MARDSFVHLHLSTDDIQQMEAASTALQEKREASLEGNPEKSMRDLLPWVQEIATKPHGRLANRHRRKGSRVSSPTATEQRNNRSVSPAGQRLSAHSM